MQRRKVGEVWGEAQGNRAEGVAPKVGSGAGPRKGEKARGEEDRGIAEWKRDSGDHHVSEGAPLKYRG